MKIVQLRIKIKKNIVHPQMGHTLISITLVYKSRVASNCSVKLSGFAMVQIILELGLGVQYIDIVIHSQMNEILQGYGVSFLKYLPFKS